MCCLAVLWPVGTLILLAWVQGYTEPEQILQAPTIWILAAAAPSALFAIVACYYRLTEKLLRYKVSVPAEVDLKKLY